MAAPEPAESAHSHELDDSQSPDGSPQPSKSTEDMSTIRVFAIWISIVCGVLCTFLDEGIISTAIPRITDEFGSLSDVGWYGSSYLLTLCGFQLVFGRLYSQFHVKTIYLASLLTFHVGSLLCALSRSSPMFIVGRAIAGCGGSGLSSGTIALFAGALPSSRLPVYMGTMGAVYGVAAVFGPVVGGLITNSYLSWRWCFYINLPLAAPPAIATLFFIHLKVPPTGKDTKGTWTQQLLTVDYLGMLLLLPGITSLILAFEFGGSAHGWSDGRTIGCFVCAGVLTAVFALEQWWMDEKALVPPRIMRTPIILFSSIFSFFLESAFLILVYYIPLWFQAIQGVTAEQSGIRYLPLCISFIAAIFSGGWIVSKMGYFQPFMLTGTILVSIGSGLLSTLQPSSGPGRWIPYQIIAGLGIGASTEQPSIAAQSFLSETDAPIGVAIVLFCRNLGPAVFISVANSIFADTLARDVGKVLPHLDLKVIRESGATALRNQVAHGDLDAFLNVYNKALTRTFVAAAALAAASAFGLLGIGRRRIPVESDVASGQETDLPSIEKAS